MNNNIVIGIDIGGSHITASCLDLQTRRLITESLVRDPVKSNGDAEQIINAWTTAIATCKARVPAASNKIGIAMPGPFDYEKGISFIKGLDKYEALYNLNIKEILANELGINVEDIWMMNDASCFLRGEIFNGSAGPNKKVLGITLGTGVGSAICLQDVFLDGDMYCYPYKDAVAEDYLSARWFVKEYHKLTGITARNVKEIRDNVSTDSQILSLFNEFGENLGKVLADYIRKYEIEMVIIGGNLINAWELFIPETRHVLNRNNLTDVQLIKSKLGEEAALIGAGSLCE